MTTVSGEWLSAKGTQAVLEMLIGDGHQAFAVGGCVRNALLDRPVQDVDIATSATPDVVVELAKATGLKPVPTGIDHGTITVVAHGTGYEVTTFRADVETDGRHARVRFSTRVEEDASRRDFTINALYADSKGHLTDPLNGLPDVMARRVRFIEDPERRIREDYLRILRFFRFSAWYGDPNLGMDPDALAAIAANLDGLDQLSRERVGSEMRKLLAAPDPVMAIAVMERIGVLHRILPGTTARTLGPLIEAETVMTRSPDAIRRLASLGPVTPNSLRLSNRDARQLALTHDLIGADQGLAEIAWRNGSDTAYDIAVLRAAAFGAPLDPETPAHIHEGVSSRFPIRAKDLMPTLQGPELGATLKKLERAWIASDFTLSREALMALAKQG